MKNDFRFFKARIDNRIVHFFIHPKIANWDFLVELMGEETLKSMRNTSVFNMGREICEQLNKSYAGIDPEEYVRKLLGETT